MFDIAEKVALVTGAASGIGFSISRQLLLNSAKGVVLADINLFEGNIALEKLSKEFGKESVTFIRTDVSDKKSFEEAFKHTVAKFGGIDILVNNAGIFDEKNYEKEIARSPNITRVIKIRGKTIEIPSPESASVSERSSSPDSFKDDPPIIPKINAQYLKRLFEDKNLHETKSISKDKKVHIIQNLVISRESNQAITDPVASQTEADMKESSSMDVEQMETDGMVFEDAKTNFEETVENIQNQAETIDTGLDLCQAEADLVVSSNIKDMKEDTSMDLEPTGKNSIAYGKVTADERLEETMENIQGEAETTDVIKENKGEEMNQSRKKLSRVKHRNPEKWACNVRKENYDRGKEYISVRKKIVPARAIKSNKDCINKCMYKCARKISEEQRKEIFSHYYQLSAQEKKMFILNTTVMTNPERRRKGKNMNNSRKANAFKYFFILNNDKVQVCKPFYCGTISISQKPIYTAHKHKTFSNTPVPSTQGKHTKKVTSEESANLVREHINMFPRIASHYCRARSKREYLEGDLSIKKMYQLYTDFIQEKNCTPVKFCIYRNIFCKEFNLSFNKPKKDRCDVCSEVDIKKAEGTLTEELNSEFERHIKEKDAMRKERNKDRENNIAVLCFDLENVLSCPKAEIKNFFYKSKLNVYNMTAHLSVDKTVYCAVWSEVLHGRTGNDMASAVYKILNQVLQEHKELKELILWSDSCVPQNRNSLMSFAVSHIIQKFPNLEKITMKFSVPGHSCVQEVDAVHSVIERSLSKSEYFSPISLLRLLIKVNKRKPYIIKQMLPQDFLDFHFYYMQMNYKEVPFSKVACLEFTKCFFQVKYKTSFLEDFVVINLRPKKNLRNHVTGSDSRSEPDIPIFLEKRDRKEINLPQAKISALQSMLKWMPEVDRLYYKNLLPEKATKTKKNIPE